MPHAERNHRSPFEQLPRPPPRPSSLYKQHSWSPDINRDEAWLKRKGNSKNRRRKSLTDEDLDELKACLELGFGFDSSDSDQRLSDTLPALELYHAVNRHYFNTLSKSPMTASFSSSTTTTSECDSPSSPIESPHKIFVPGENPQTMKTRLRHWAQVVAFSVKQLSG